MLEHTIRPAGDAALHVAFAERIDPHVNANCVALSRALRTRLGRTLRDVAIGYATVTVYFNPLEVDANWLQGEIETAIDEIGTTGATAVSGDGAVLEVPVRYGGDMGPDLPDVAEFAGCSASQVIERHTAREYRVYLVGFVPGFAYMAEVDPVIAAPRRPTPRTAVPPGSVAIAGGQTGIYPIVTPGGWNIIGRTSLLPYDPSRAEPFLFRPGDRVRFKEVETL